MAEIELAGGFVALIDDDDFDRVSAMRWYRQHRYAVHGRGGSRPTPGGRIYLHRFVMNAPPGLIVDHVNGNGLDCRKVNLRVGDLSLNSYNRSTCNKFGFRGVRANRSKFAATVWKDGVRHSSPSFDTLEDAAKAYDAMALALYGESARLNFPNGAAA